MHSVSDKKASRTAVTSILVDLLACIACVGKLQRAVVMFACCMPLFTRRLQLTHDIGDSQSNLLVFVSLLSSMLHGMVLSALSACGGVRS